MFGRSKSKVTNLYGEDKPKLPVYFLIIVLLTLAFFGGSYLNSKQIIKIFPIASSAVAKAPVDKYNAFFLEVYDLIKDHYWNVMTDDQLENITKLAVEKLTGSPIPFTAGKQPTISEILTKATEKMTDNQKQDFYPQLADLVLSNLEPFGRSRLYSQKQTQDLSNTVNNIEPGTDIYADLGVSKDATKQQIQDAYNNKLAELNKEAPSTDKDSKIAALEKAYSTLSNDTSKKTYDQTGIQSATIYKLYGTRVLYIDLTKFTPTSAQDFVDAADANASNNNLDTLIIDLRGNIGGLIEGLPYFLGPFIGNDQYAYQFFSRGDKLDFKTKVGLVPSLAKFNKVIVLIDGMTQSSAELFASVLKKYHVAVLVGQKTRGWGTVENVTTLKNQISDSQTYSVLLVNSLTVREDGALIEGNGVLPDIDITQAGWENELLNRFNFPEIVDAVKHFLNTK